MLGQIVLVVNSNNDQAKRIRECLQKAGFQVITASLGQSALEIVRSRRPDVMLLDWKLPDLSGLAVIRKIRSDEITFGLPIILTGVDMREEDLMIGLEAGADLCLKEPFHPDVFIARVRALLRRRHLYDPLFTVGDK
jgi:DNA-binding response OmpR family regulator